MPKSPIPTTALYVRLPAEQAEKLDRASHDLGIPKKDLVAELIGTLSGPVVSGRGSATEPAPRRPHAGPDGMALGAYDFHAYEQPEVLTAEQAGQLLQLEEQEVIRLAAAGELPGRRLGDAWRFSRSALVGWLSVTPQH